MPNQTRMFFSYIVLSSYKIDDREKDIIKKRLRGRTLEQIGKKMKVSAERVRQIEEEALEKMSDKVYQMVLFEK